MIDSHVHTRRCHHAQGRMEEYVAAAVNAGLSSVCFLEHFTPADSDHRASMALDEIPAYLSRAHELRDRFRDQIDVRVGLEIDFQPEYTDLYRQVIADYPFDAVGSSIHTIDGIDIVSSGTDWQQGLLDEGDIERRYWERLAQMVTAGYFDFICHFDLIKKFDRKIDPRRNDRIEPILKAVRGQGLAIEFNTSGLVHPVAEAYPAQDVLERCRWLGIDVTLSSDAHQPDHVARFFDQGRRQLKTAGFDHVVWFDRRQPKRITI